MNGSRLVLQNITAIVDRSNINGICLEQENLTLFIDSFSINWFHLAKNRVKWRAFLTSVMNPRFP